MRLLKWILLIPAILLLGYIAAEKLHMSQQAHVLTGIDPQTAGATCSPDWEALNPLGCRYRFLLPAEAFTHLCQQQLTSGNGWEKLAADAEASFPALSELRIDGAAVYLNTQLPNRVRWVVYHPETEFLYLGYYMH